MGTGTAGIPLHAYLFLPKKKNFPDTGRVESGTGWVRAGTKTKPNDVVSTRFLLLSYSILSPLSQAEPLNSLSQAEPFDSLSHFLTLPATGDGRCFDSGLAATEGAPIVDLRRGRCSDFDFSYEYENTGQKKGRDKLLYF